MESSKQVPGPAPRVAYFSMEIGLEARMPTYSGGLGVLAGDSLRAAADLGLPVIGVTLVHRKGYFRQMLDALGQQTDAPDPWDPEGRLVDVGPRVQLTLEGRTVHVRAWEYLVRSEVGGQVSVYLLDTDVPENAPQDRVLTDHLYGGDRRYRLMQEAILGIGGVRMLRAAGHAGLRGFHLNEGHSALLALELLVERCGDKGLAGATERMVKAVRSRCVFTTHTPVAAGHDRFDMALVEKVLGGEMARALAERGSELDGSVLNLSLLAFNFSRWSNAVAYRHGEVSRGMFPGRVIHAVTNGVHVPTWTSAPFAELFDRRTPGWRVDPVQLRHAITLPLAEVRAAHGVAKARLLKEVEERTGQRLHPGVFTIGFARRATPYKRADLLLTDVERLAGIAEREGGLQILYAGKAHPQDKGGQALIKSVVEAGTALAGRISLVYLPNYDMDLGALLSAGVDVWLNTPTKPQEASGTSGMKACLNGVPNLSVLDGWWVEGHVEGVTGWSLDGDREEPANREAETEALYRKLEHVILPMYYGNPEAFARVQRSAIALNGSHFTTRRMMLQYATDAYGLKMDLTGAGHRTAAG